MAKNNQTYYEILGVSPTATLKEIKIAYRRKAKELHPDVNNNSSHEMMYVINEIFRVLKDPELRKAYDESLQEKVEFSNENEEDETDKTTSNNSFKKNMKHTHKNSSNNNERYNYYNSIDFSAYEQEEFIDWLENFANSYILFAYDKVLNTGDKHILRKLEEIFDNIIDNEKKSSKKNTRTKHL